MPDPIRAMLDAEAALADADPDYPCAYVIGDPLPPPDDEEILTNA